MTIIELGRPSRGTYRILFEMPDTAMLLARFLLADVGNDIESFIEEFEDDNRHVGSMNATQYTKGDGIVLITPEYRDEDESIEQGNYYAIKAIVLAEVLRQWKPVRIQMPPFITITIDNDNVTVIGSYEFVGEREGRRLHLLKDD